MRLGQNFEADAAVAASPQEAQKGQKTSKTFRATKFEVRQRSTTKIGGLPWRQVFVPDPSLRVSKTRERPQDAENEDKLRTTKIDDLDEEPRTTKNRGRNSTADAADCRRSPHPTFDCRLVGYALTWIRDHESGAWAANPCIGVSAPET